MFEISKKTEKPLNFNNLPTSIVDILRERSLSQPNDLALVFLDNGEHETHRWTHADLDRRARAIAAVLQQQFAPGDRVLLLYPSGNEFVAALLGCFYAGVVAVPSYPPHPVQALRTLPRLVSIVEDAEPKAILSDPHVLGYAGDAIAQTPSLAKIPILDTGAISQEAAEGWRRPALKPSDLAFLQYSSGSTAAPKGVMLSHRNLLTNSECIRVACEHDATTPIVCWLPLYHDLGLIGCLLQALYVGAPCYLMTPTAFLQRPLKWLRAISKYRAHTTAAPNFAFDLCLRRTTPEQRKSLDLQHWRVAINAAEPVRASTLQAFTEAFAESGFQPGTFFPAFGLAEATVFVSGPRAGHPPVICRFDPDGLAEGRIQEAPAGRPMVGCGIQRPGIDVRIVDPETGQPCPLNRMGEIWVGGEGIGQGYWKRPEQSEQDFRASMADGSGPFLRTGDLGFFHQEQLFIAGRLKDLIIVDGRNHYPQDLELTVESSHPAIRPNGTGVFSLELDGAERVVVVAEADVRPPQPSTVEDTPAVDLLADIIAQVRRAVTGEHDLPLHDVVLLKPGALPKTTSGKVQRHACRKAWLAGTLKTHQTQSEPEASEVGV